MPSTDRSAIKQIIAAITDAGWTLDRVDNGEEVIDLTDPNLDADRDAEALEQITGTTDAVYLFVVGPSKAEGYVLFVLGNEPFEVAADYTENLNAVIEPLTDRWS